MSTITIIKQRQEMFWVKKEKQGKASADLGRLVRCFSSKMTSMQSCIDIGRNIVKVNLSHLFKGVFGAVGVVRILQPTSLQSRLIIEHHTQFRRGQK